MSPGYLYESDTGKQSFVLLIRISLSYVIVILSNDTNKQIHINFSEDNPVHKGTEDNSEYLQGPFG